MRYRLVRELAADGVVVAVACRVLAVSTAGYYEWGERAPSARAVADQALSEQIVEIHAMSRGSYGAPRVHAELRLGRGVRCGRKRVARLMRSAGLHGIYRRRGRHARPAPAVHDDLVRRRQVSLPSQQWLTNRNGNPNLPGSSPLLGYEGQRSKRSEPHLPSWQQCRSFPASEGGLYARSRCS